MLQLNLALKEITQFLNTVTIKNTYSEQHILETQVAKEFRASLPMSKNPYYRHLMGEYILEEDCVIVPSTIDRYTDSTNIIAETTLVEDWNDPTGQQTIRNKLLYTKFDTMMKITSLDNGEEICFTKDNLHRENGHKKTLAAYKLPSRYYEILCEKYPDQTALIKSIVYPIQSFSTEIESYENQETITQELLTSVSNRIVELNTAITDQLIAYQNRETELKAMIPPGDVNTDPTCYDITQELIRLKTERTVQMTEQDRLNEELKRIKTSLEIYREKTIYAAPNYKVLMYDDSLLNENERASLVNRMFTTLDLIRTRYDIPRYAFEDCYGLGLGCIVENMLYLQLVTQRIQNIRTNSAHPVYIWEYLESKGLANYRGYLTASQEMFLYRNLRYILENKGKHKILNLLVDEFLSESGVTATAKSIVQSMERYYQDGYRTTPQIINESLDVDQSFDITGSPESLDSVFQKEFRGGLEPVYTPEVVSKQEIELGYLENTYSPTKLIELTRVLFNPKFYELFCSFVTSTLFGMAAITAPNNNTIVNELVYKFQVGGDGSSLTLSMPEVLALLDYIIRCEIKDPAIVNSDGSINTNIEIPTKMYCETIFKFQKPTTFPKIINWHCESNIADRGDVIYPISVSDYCNPEEMFKNYISLTSISTQEQLGNYLTTMFTLLKEQVNLSCNVGSLKHNLVLDTLIRHTLNPGEITLDLVNGITTYSEWFGINKDLGNYIKALKLREDFQEAVTSFGTQLVSILLFGCDINYAKINLDDVIYQKMKELVRRLLSYNVAIIDSDIQSTMGITTVPIFAEVASFSGTVTIPHYIETYQMLPNGTTGEDTTVVSYGSTINE